MPQGEGEASQELTQVSTKGLIKCQRLRLGSQTCKTLPRNVSNICMMHVSLTLTFTQVGTPDMYISLSGCPNATKVTKVYSIHTQHVLAYVGPAFW